jgi:hypothetical protein
MLEGARSRKCWRFIHGAAAARGAERGTERDGGSTCRELEPEQRGVADGAAYSEAEKERPVYRGGRGVRRAGCMQNSAVAGVVDAARGSSARNVDVAFS